MFCGIFPQHVADADSRLKASPTALVSWINFLKKKEDKNPHPTETLSISSSILVLYPGGAAGHLCLALSVSYSFLNFGEAVGFHPFSLTISFYIISI